jgi:hypothetical protein
MDLSLHASTRPSQVRRPRDGRFASIGRTSGNEAIEGMKTKLAADNYRFGSLVEAIVISDQFWQNQGNQKEACGYDES